MADPTFPRLACTWDDDDDRLLVERHLEGDREAFTALVVRYQRTVYNAAFWVLRRHEDASDVSQDVFLKLAERAGDYDPKFRFFSWIYRIAVNEALNQLRRHRREEPLDEDFDLADGGDRDPEQRAMAAQSAAQVRAAMLRLSTGDRVVLTLRHFSECSYDDMAQILAIDEKTVKSRLFDARRRLRGLLKAQSIESPT